MTDNPEETFVPVPYGESWEYHQRSPWLGYSLFFAQPVALVATLCTYFYQEIYNPRVSNPRLWAAGTQRFHPEPSYIGIWIGITAAAFFLAVLRLLAGLMKHRRNQAEWRDGLPARIAKTRAEREARNREAEAARQAEIAKLKAIALVQRQARIAQLEVMVLNARAEAMAADFLGTRPASFYLPSLRQQLVRLAISDLGLLRESDNPAVREVVGDGLFLPPTQALQIPAITPPNNPR